MALNEVAAEAPVGAEGAFEVDEDPGLQSAQRGDAERFGRDVRFEGAGGSP